VRWRIEPLVRTRVAAVLLFAAGLAAYAVEALAWPVARGRDTWDYLSYYLELPDGHAVFPSLMLYRTPVAPVVLGGSLQLGGDHLLEVVMALLYAGSIVAYAAAALTFGELPALLTGLVLLADPGYATLFHTANSDGVLAAGLAFWTLLVVRTWRSPSTRRFAAVGAGLAVLALTRPASQVLLVAVLLPLVVRAPWGRRLRFAAAFLVSAFVLLGAWAVDNGLRYGQYTVSRAAEQRTFSASTAAGANVTSSHVAQNFWSLLQARPIREPGKRQPTRVPSDPAARGYAVPTAHDTAELRKNVASGFLWCRSDFIQRCTLDPSTIWTDSGQRRQYADLVRRLTSWNAELPSRDGSVFVANQLKRVSWKFPRPPFWLLLALVGLVLRRPRGGLVIVALSLLGAVLILTHAYLQKAVVADYALPAYPIFVLAGIALTTGELRRRAA
jgi:4-amino-4-deoxy-L-arabinose transferase-like glycosyltransferase